MVRTTHLNSLQALEMALREGSLQAAAEKLGITPAAVGQRIRTLEQFLETDLLLRGRSGLQPTPALNAALEDLHAAFSALDRAAEILEFQRAAEIHILADPDWSDLWLLPRLQRFRDDHPSILFNINGEGDVPMRIGAADIMVDRNPTEHAAGGRVLYHEVFLPVGSPQNAARIADPRGHSARPIESKQMSLGTLGYGARAWQHSERGSLEGFPLLHIKPRDDAPDTPNWSDWVEASPHQRTAPERGVQYALVRNALEAVEANAGLLLCGLSCVIDKIAEGLVVLPFPRSEHLRARHPYRIHIRQAATMRPQISFFADWLVTEAEKTRIEMEDIIGPPGLQSKQ